MYTKFETGVPLITDTGGEQITDIRNNLEALRDAIVAGTLVDWEQTDVTTTKGTGTDAEPDELIWKKGTEWIRAQITWGTTGGQDGNPTQIIYAYSSNSGGAYDTIGTMALAYTAAGILQSTTWT